MERLEEERQRIDAIDKQLVELLQKRLLVSQNIAEIKEEMGKPVFDSDREKQKLDQIRSVTEPEFADSLVRTYQFLMQESKEKQKEYLQKTGK